MLAVFAMFATATTFRSFTTTPMLMSIGTLARGRGLSHFTFDFGERCSNKLAIHCSNPPKKDWLGLKMKLKTPDAFGNGDERDANQQTILSQAAAIRGEQSNFFP
jgi:hypothetical protein